MAGTGGSEALPTRDSPRNRPKALAFYLPQYHPIPENDEWWGKGFTEWSNVSKAQPRFPGHYQPHLPGELGFYDLRLPEVRQAQADLAREHGIHGFAYYHYWFQGKRLLERPFNEVLASGEPDFPFALCWANEAWTRNWEAETGQVLMPQHFSREDDLEHIRWLLQAFADDRYIKIDGRPLMLVYRPALIPHIKATADLWRTEAQKAGFPDLYLCWVESWGPPPGGPEAFGLDASVGFMPAHGEQIYAPIEGLRSHRVLDYRDSFERQLARSVPEWKRFPSVMLSWDNTARRAFGATIFDGATPDAYEEWLRRTVDTTLNVREEENYLFLLAWNEWAEGNHLEPDQRYGRQWLERTRTVLLDPVPAEKADLHPREMGGTAVQAAKAARKNETRDDLAEVAEHALRLVRALTPAGLPVVDLGAGAARHLATEAVPPSALEYVAVVGDTERSDDLAPAGHGAHVADLGDPDSLLGELDRLDEVRALLLLDLLPTLEEPHLLLTRLSDWALKHGSPLLVISSPNVSHFDTGLRLLTGEWQPTPTGALGVDQRHQFTSETLGNLVARTGWQLVDHEDVCAFRSDLYDEDLMDALPVELVAALRIMASAYNEDSSVSRYVWALRPVPITSPPSSFLDAISPSDEREPGSLSLKDEKARIAAERRDKGVKYEQAQKITEYLTSVGLVTTEVNRRAAATGRYPQFGNVRRWKDIPVKLYALRWVYGTPTRAAVFKRVHRIVRGGGAKPPTAPKDTGQPGHS